MALLGCAGTQGREQLAKQRAEQNYGKAAKQNLEHSDLLRELGAAYRNAGLRASPPLRRQRRRTLLRDGEANVINVVKFGDIKLNTLVVGAQKGLGSRAQSKLAGQSHFATSPNIPRWVMSKRNGVIDT